MQSIRAAAGLLLFAGACTSAPAKAPTILTYTDHQPLDGMRTRFLNEVFFPAIERESEGRLRVEAHWDGEIAAAYDGLGTVSAGERADMAVVVPEYTAKALPLHQIFKSFPVGPSGAEQVRRFRAIYDRIPEFGRELEDNHIRPVLLATGYPAGFFARAPLKGPESLAGQKWRSASFWHLDFMEHAGATPVRMHWGPEIYTALKEGRLDGILVNIDSAYNLDLHRSAPHALVSKRLWLGHLYIIAIHQERWQQLEPRDQAAITRAAEFAYARLGEVMDASYAEMVAALEQGGAEVRTLSDEEVEAWARATGFPEAQARWAAKQKEEGVPNAAEVIRKVAAELGRPVDR